MKIKSGIIFISVWLALYGIAAGQTVFKSGIADQAEIRVTVYNNNLGLIKYIREVKLPAGKGELQLEDVASHIIPESVHVKSMNYTKDFSVHEQYYKHDLINADTLLDKYVGEKIKIVDWNRYQDRKEVIEATLLSNNQGQIYKINDEIYLGYPGYKVLPEIPGTFTSKPTLIWHYENRSTNTHTLEVSYLTKNMNWKADYVLVLNQDDTTADLSGWATLDNKSGAMYKDARLTLVAGDVHRVRDRHGERSYALRATEMAGAPQFKEKSFFEYHIYDLQRKTTILDKQTKQVSLLEAGNVHIKKELQARGIKSYFFGKHQDQNLKQAVEVYIKFKNSEDNNLGMPLPEGIVRSYKQGDDGSLQFIGEAGSEHTPRDEEVSLKVGEAFDVTAERIQTDYKRIANRLYESEWEITLRNHKEKDVSVGIVEPLSGNWTVLSNTHPYKKIDAFTIRFDVPVPRDKEITVQYRLRVGL